MLLLLLPMLLVSCTDDTKSNNNGQSLINSSAKGNADSGGITLSDTNIKCFNGSSGILTYTSKNKKISWESSDKNIITVSNGVWITKSSGTAVITAKTSDGYSASCIFNIVEPIVCGFYPGVVYTKDDHPYYRVKFTFDTFLYNAAISGSTMKISIQAMTITVSEVTRKSSSWDGRTASCYIYMRIVDNSNTEVTKTKQMYPFVISKVPETLSSSSTVSISAENISIDKAPYKLLLNLNYN